MRQPSGRLVRQPGEPGGQPVRQPNDQLPRRSVGQSSQPIIRHPAHQTNGEPPTAGQPDQPSRRPAGLPSDESSSRAAGQPDQTPRRPAGSPAPQPGEPGAVRSERQPTEQPTRPPSTGQSAQQVVHQAVHPQPAPGSRGEHLLQCAYGTQDKAQRFYRDQVLDRLNDEMIEFVSRMEMAFIGTADAGGECDSTFRAGPPGFLHVLDARRIAYPEYRGNGVLASLGNISENPHIGMLMIDFTEDLIGLHVNGRARIVEDSDLRAEWPELPRELERGRTPERWVVVHVEEAYIHCRKHIPRMQPVPRDRDWGSDDVRRKGGDYFGVRARQSATTR